MVTSIGAALQNHRALLPERARQSVDGDRKLEVQYVRNASKWNGFSKLAAVVAFPVAVVAAMRGSYTRRLMMSGNQLPAPIDTGVQRTDWKKVLGASRDSARIGQMNEASQAQLRSIAIKLIGATGQDQGLRALWRSPDTSTSDLVKLAAHCVADRTGEFRNSIFNALRGEVTQSHQRERSVAFVSMREAFKADEVALRAQIGEVNKPDAKAGGLEIAFLLTGDQIRALGSFKVQPEHFDQIRPLMAELTRMPNGTPDERTAWLNQTLSGHRDGARLLALIPDLLSEKALAEMGELKTLLDKDRPFIDALRQALDIKGLDAKGKEALHSEPVQSEKKGFFGKLGNLAKTANKAAHAINLKAEIEKKIRQPVDAAHAEAFAQSIDEAVDRYDFSVYTAALANMTGDLPPELGKFLEDVLQRYFSSQTLGDKKMMLQSLYQQGNSAEPLDHMVALLKGAGPFMQKIVQQLGSQAKDPEVAKALQSLKENLNPIDDEERLVLLSAVAGSIGAEGMKMSNIRVLSSASVAETLSVTLEPPEGQPGQPREVIVKLLRPGIVERAGRERAFFERVAAERGQAAGGGDGLVRTMASIADQIESELDLRFEADEILKAQVYAGRPEAADGGVKVMTMAAGQKARAEFLILDKMPGRSVKGFIGEMEAAAQDPSVTPARLQELKDQGEALCQRLVALNTMWLKEALFGSGFFHGDLHAGNLMVDTPEGGPTTLGMIDFGNAATLEPKVQRDFLRIQAACIQRHPELSIDALRGLLPPDARARLDLVRPMLALELKGLMVKDDANELVGDLVGEFLSAATQFGIEIPGPMLQMGRSQTMLIDTFERAYKALGEVSKRTAVDKPLIPKDAMDHAAERAVTGSLRALMGKAGFGFGASVIREGDVQRMWAGFEVHPASVERQRVRDEAVHRFNELKSQLSSAEIPIKMELITAQGLIGNGPLAALRDDQAWKDWAAGLAPELKERTDDLLLFRAFCDAPGLSVPDDWVRIQPFAGAIDPELAACIERLSGSAARVAELRESVAGGSPAELKVGDLVDAVLEDERKKFRATQAAAAVAQPGGPAVDASSQPLPAAEPQPEGAAEAMGEGGQLLPSDPGAGMQEGLARRLSAHILSEGGDGLPQPV